MKVCFVCLGNICRSPMAEGLYQKRIRDLGLSHLISVESRATSSYEIGRPPHPGTAKILRRENAELVGKKAQRISTNDVEEFDIIIGMDQDNVNDLKQITGKHQHKIYLYRDIHPNTKGEDVLDPYYTGEYENTFQAIHEMIDLWMDHFQKTLKSY